eukprot:3412889-Pleurochrysis_carterae.AAC.1
MSSGPVVDESRLRSPIVMRETALPSLTRGTTDSRAHAKESGRTPPPTELCADTFIGSHTDVAVGTVSFAVGRKGLVGS